MVGQVLFLIMLAFGLAVWIQPTSEWRQRLRQAWTDDSVPRPPWAFWAAAIWIMLILINRVAIDSSGGTIEPSPNQVWTSLYLSCGLLAILASLLFADLSHPGMTTVCGADWQALRTSTRLGVESFLAAVVPTILALLLTQPFRSAETEHTLLQLLREHPDPATLAALIITVVLLAPLAEELVFRVTLQGELTHRMGFRWAWPITAVMFAAVHGWRDGLALLPLSLILGSAYYHGRNYYSVVIAHGLFNAVNLALAFGSGER